MHNIKYDKVKLNDIATLRGHTCYTVGIQDCKEALEKNQWNIDDALHWMEERGLIKSNENFVPLCPDAPAVFTYIRSKAQTYLKTGPDKYRKIDYFKMPLTDWNSKTLDLIQLGFEQIVECRGYEPEAPVEDVGIEGFYRMMETLHFVPSSQEAAFHKDFILDEIVFEHRITDQKIKLYNRVDKPKD